MGEQSDAINSFKKIYADLSLCYIGTNEEWLCLHKHYVDIWNGFTWVKWVGITRNFCVVIKTIKSSVWLVSPVDGSNLPPKTNVLFWLFLRYWKKFLLILLILLELFRFPRNNTTHTSIYHQSKQYRIQLFVVIYLLQRLESKKLARFSVPHTAQKMRSSISNKKLQCWHLTNVSSA